MNDTKAGEERKLSLAWAARQWLKSGIRKSLSDAFSLSSIAQAGRIKKVTH